MQLTHHSYNFKRHNTAVLIYSTALAINSIKLTINTLDARTNTHTDQIFTHKSIIFSSFVVAIAIARKVLLFKQRIDSEKVWKSNKVFCLKPKNLKLKIG